jgi:dUTP pyrophosphatase
MYGKGKVEIDQALTLEKLGIDVSTLHVGSHKRIHAKCTRCNESILREFRHLYKKHNCPIYIVKNGQDLKWCNCCSKFLLLDVFSKNAARYDGLASRCKSCTKESSIDKEAIRSKKQISTLDGWMKNLILKKRIRAANVGLDYDLSFDYMMELWKKQNGMCIYSGLPLSFGNKSLTSAHLERTNSKKGYVVGNVSWSSKAMNLMKNDSSLIDFKYFLKNSNPYHHDHPRFEVVLFNEKAKLPALSKPFDAGYDISSVEDYILQARSVTDIKTGLRISVPPGFYLTMEGRSSLFKHSIEPLRGIIDATYTGELIITLSNTSDKAYMIRSGERVAQLIVHKVYHFDFVEVEDFSIPYRIRGTEGFGSSGR